LPLPLPIPAQAETLTATRVATSAIKSFFIGWYPCELRYHLATRNSGLELVLKSHTPDPNVPALKSELDCRRGAASSSDMHAFEADSVNQVSPHSIHLNAGHCHT
jgi:hypothetical protein